MAAKPKRGVTKKDPTRQSAHNCKFYFHLVWNIIQLLVKELVLQVKRVRHLNPVLVIARRQRLMYFTDNDGNIPVKPQWRERLFDLFRSENRRKKLLLQWLKTKIPEHQVDNFSRSWTDGIALCALLEAVRPGSCAGYNNMKHHNIVTNCRIGIRLAQQCLDLPQNMITPEEMAIADTRTESKIFQFICAIKWLSEQSDQKSSNFNSHTDTPPQCQAKGTGLCTGVTGKKARFSLHVLDVYRYLDIDINIRGPRNDKYGEKIVNVLNSNSPKDLSLNTLVKPNTTDTTALDRKWNSKYQLIGYLDDEAGNVFLRIKDKSSSGSSVYSGITFSCQCNGTGTYLFTYLPIYAGIHTISLRLGRHHVDGSPFKVKVYQPCDFKRKSVKETNDKRFILDSMSLGSQDDSITTYLRGVTNNYPQDNKEQGITGQHNKATKKLDRTSSTSARLKRQYTIRKKRVLRKVVTKNGEEVIVQDSASSSSLSRQANVWTDSSDMAEEDKDGKSSRQIKFWRTQSDGDVSRHGHDKPVRNNLQENDDSDMYETVSESVDSSPRLSTKHNSDYNKIATTSNEIQPTSKHTTLVDGNQSNTFPSPEFSSIDGQESFESSESTCGVLKLNEYNKRLLNRSQSSESKCHQKTRLDTLDLFNIPASAKTSLYSEVKGGPTFQNSNATIPIPSHYSGRDRLCPDKPFAVTSACGITHYHSGDELLSSLTHCDNGRGLESGSSLSSTCSSVAGVNERQASPVQKTGKPLETFSTNNKIYGDGFESTVDKSCISEKSEEVSSTRENMAAQRNARRCIAQSDTIADLTSAQNGNGNTTRKWVEDHRNKCSSPKYISHNIMEQENSPTSLSNHQNIDMVSKSSPVISVSTNIPLVNANKGFEISRINNSEAETSLVHRDYVVVPKYACDLSAMSAVDHFEGNRECFRRHSDSYLNPRNDKSGAFKAFRTIPSFESALYLPSSNRIIAPKPHSEKCTQVKESEIVEETGCTLDLSTFRLIRRRIAVKMPHGIYTSIPEMLTKLESCDKSYQYVKADEKCPQNINEEEPDICQTQNSIHYLFTTNPVSSAEGTGLSDEQLEAGRPSSDPLVESSNTVRRTVRQSTTETIDSGIADDNTQFGITSRPPRGSRNRYVSGHKLLHRRPYRGTIHLDPKLVRSNSNPETTIDEDSRYFLEGISNKSNVTSKCQKVAAGLATQRCMRQMQRNNSISLSDSELHMSGSLLSSFKEVSSMICAAERIKLLNKCVQRVCKCGNNCREYINSSDESIEMENLYREQCRYVSKEEFSEKHAAGQNVNSGDKPIHWKSSEYCTDSEELPATQKKGIVCFTLSDQSLEDSYQGFGISKDARKALLGQLDGFQACTAVVRQNVISLSAKASELSKSEEDIESSCHEVDEFNIAEHPSTCQTYERSSEYDTTVQKKGKENKVQTKDNWCSDYELGTTCTMRGTDSLEKPHESSGDLRKVEQDAAQLDLHTGGISEFPFHNDVTYNPSVASNSCPKRFLSSIAFQVQSSRLTNVSVCYHFPLYSSLSYLPKKQNDSSLSLSTEGTYTRMRDSYLPEKQNESSLSLSAEGAYTRMQDSHLPEKQYDSSFSLIAEGTYTKMQDSYLLEKQNDTGSDNDRIIYDEVDQSQYILAMNTGHNENFPNIDSDEIDKFLLEDIPLANAGHLHVDGSGLIEGQVGIKNNFQIWSDGEIIGCPTVAIYGPRSHSVVETTIVYTGDNLYEVMYEVIHPGVYVITVKWCDVEVQKSPYLCRVTY